MQQHILPCYATSLKESLTNHLLSHSELLTNTVTEGHSSNYTWSNVELCLMTEPQVCGTVVFSSSGHDMGISYKQLPVFHFLHGLNSSFWLRSVINSTSFEMVSATGAVFYEAASTPHTVVPLILFG